MRVRFLRCIFGGATLQLDSKKLDRTFARFAAGESPKAEVLCRKLVAIDWMWKLDLEHFHFYCRVPRRSLNHASAFSCVISGSSSVIAWSRASLVRALTVRSSCLSLDQAFSMGFRSGE